MQKAKSKMKADFFIVKFINGTRINADATDYHGLFIRVDPQNPRNPRAIVVLNRIQI